jgi:hypothetical protein
MELAMSSPVFLAFALGITVAFLSVAIAWVLFSHRNAPPTEARLAAPAEPDPASAVNEPLPGHSAPRAGLASELTAGVSAEPSSVLRKRKPPSEAQDHAAVLLPDVSGLVSGPRSEETSRLASPQDDTSDSGSLRPASSLASTPEPQELDATGIVEPTDACPAADESVRSSRKRVQGSPALSGRSTSQHSSPSVRSSGSSLDGGSRGRVRKSLPSVREFGVVRWVNGTAHGHILRNLRSLADRDASARPAGKAGAIFFTGNDVRGGLELRRMDVVSYSVQPGKPGAKGNRSKPRAVDIELLERDGKPHESTPPEVGLQLMSPIDDDWQRDIVHGGQPLIGDGGLWPLDVSPSTDGGLPPLNRFKERRPAEISVPLDGGDLFPSHGEIKSLSTQSALSVTGTTPAQGLSVWGVPHSSGWAQEALMSTTASSSMTSALLGEETTHLQNVVEFALMEEEEPEPSTPVWRRAGSKGIGEAGTRRSRAAEPAGTARPPFRPPPSRGFTRSAQSADASRGREESFFSAGPSHPRPPLTIQARVTPPASPNLFAASPMRDGGLFTP